ncbi:hypothetical protein Tel_11985 [Candidatus Tenderia electrophaga]|jgi:hypothetical protein|uniref:Uncharacterized protein n=1 Tax=Candidatus Tenderia electrophaga TaxID=1748243 RepID=A0A0S2TF64_9GAMM|nr:hypothetical protein Tel_11985 [Candidatus Tenderia electrophaga]
MSKPASLAIGEAATSAAGALADPAAAAARYLQQLNTLILARHVTLLMIEAQKHRGASLAVLAGNREFMPRVVQSQQVIRRYLAVIDHLNRHSGKLIADAHMRTLKRDWLALIEHWQTDPAMTNFEFHNHFIDSMIKHIWQLVGDARLARARVESGGAAMPGMSKLVLNITLKLMPELLENIARLRGLATHVCSLGHSDTEFDSRFVSLIHALNMNKEKMRIVCRALQHDTLRAVPSLPEILLHDHKLDQLQQTVTRNISGAASIQLNSKELFDFASDIIDSYSQVIHDGISFFRRRIERELGGV